MLQQTNQKTKQIKQPKTLGWTQMVHKYCSIFVLSKKKKKKKPKPAVHKNSTQYLSKAIKRGLNKWKRPCLTIISLHLGRNLYRGPSQTSLSWEAIKAGWNKSLLAPHCVQMIFFTHLHRGLKEHSAWVWWNGDGWNGDDGPATAACLLWGRQSPAKAERRENRRNPSIFQLTKLP